MRGGNIPRCGNMTSHLVCRAAAPPPNAAVFFVSGSELGRGIRILSASATPAFSGRWVRHENWGVTEIGLSKGRPCSGNGVTQSPEQFVRRRF